MPPVPDPHANLRDAALYRVIDGPGHTDTALRRAAASGSGLPGELQPLVDKVHRHAYKVTSEEVALLNERYDDDQLFEIIVSAALGASKQRLDAGLRALEEA